MEDDDLDEDSQDESPEEEVAEPTEEVVDPKKWAKLQSENRSLRGRLRRSELTAKYGAKISELIPDSLPLKEWDAQAERLQEALQATAAGTEETAETKAAEEPPSPTEQALAAVSSSSSAASGGPDLYGEMSAKEIGELFARDPAAGIKAMSGKYADST